MIDSKAEYHYDRFSTEEYRRRFENVRKAMRANHLDCLVIYGTSGVGSSVNVRYLSNYADYLQCYIIFPVEENPSLFMSIDAHLLNAKAISLIEDVRCAGKDNIATGVAKRIKELGLDTKKIGIVGIAKRVQSIPHDHYLILKEELPQGEFENATFLFEEIRANPSQEEVEVLRESGKLCDKIMGVLVDEVRPGITEYQLAAKARYAAEQEGGYFHILLLGSTPTAHPNMPYPWPFPSKRVIQAGDLILTELSVGTMEGYSGQVIRPIALGEPDEEYWNLYHVALRVYRGVIPLLKTGNRPRQFLDVSRMIPESGFTIQAPIIHGRAGTSIPPVVRIPEMERDNPSLDQELRENQTLQVEPNPCTKDLKKGIFLGDMYRVTSKGGESYQKYPLEFVIKKF